MSAATWGNLAGKIWKNKCAKFRKSRLWNVIMLSSYIFKLRWQLLEIGSSATLKLYHLIKKNMFYRHLKILFQISVCFIFIMMNICNYLCDMQNTMLMNYSSASLQHYLNTRLYSLILLSVYQGKAGRWKSQLKKSFCNSVFNIKEVIQ